MILILYVIALVLFLLAWLTGGVHATAADFIALGLAFLTAAITLHAFPTAWPGPRR